LDDAYLAQLRRAIEDAGVELWQVLADAGDITHPADGERDALWIAQWIYVAHTLGAKRVRVIAGKQMPTRENLIKSRDTILRLSEKAQPLGIRLVTENWFDLLDTPDDVLWLLEQTQGQLGLCLDFGNWKGERKYAGFEAIAPMAESCHAKPQFDAGGSVELNDYTRCLDITKAAGFAGPYTLIYDGPNADEFAGLEAEKRIVQPYCI
jgi:sugar phosphate isomerase/epimerase